MKLVRLQPYAPVTFTLPLYLFLIEADSTPGSYCDRKDYVNEKFK
jgi:hypothetical protein